MSFQLIWTKLWKSLLAIYFQIKKIIFDYQKISWSAFIKIKTIKSCFDSQLLPVVAASSHVEWKITKMNEKISFSRLLIFSVCQGMKNFWNLKN